MKAYSDKESKCNTSERNKKKTYIHALSALMFGSMLTAMNDGRSYVQEAEVDEPETENEEDE